MEDAETCIVELAVGAEDRNMAVGDAATLLYGLGRRNNVGGFALSCSSCFDPCLLGAFVALA